MMNESIKYKYEDLCDYSKEELESLILKEDAYIQNGETLIEAMLSSPFKNKEKFNLLKEKILIHQQNKSLILNRIEEITPKIIDNQSWSNSNILLGYKTNSTITTSTITSIPSYTKMELTKIKYADNYNEIQEGEVLDDIFQSILSDYYMQSPTGSIIPLKRIIDIDVNSKTGKWYETMCKNFERCEKLKRVTKDDNNE